jgi:fluoroquinolone resistance protein
MTNVIKISETLSNLTMLSKATEREDYEKCEFVNCTFADISHLNFINCIFKNCNLSSCKINNAKLQGVHFVDCKLLGMNFFQAKDFTFEVYFVKCLLDYASFDSKKLNKSKFTQCKMHEVNFTNADLSKSLLVDCDLYDAVFANTNLSGVDFTGSSNFAIDPEINTIKKAKFLSQDLFRLLTRHDIIIE